MLHWSWRVWKLSLLRISRSQTWEHGSNQDLTQWLKKAHHQWQTGLDPPGSLPSTPLFTTLLGIWGRMLGFFSKYCRVLLWRISGGRSSVGWLRVSQLCDESLQLFASAHTVFSLREVKEFGSGWDVGEKSSPSWQWGWSPVLRNQIMTSFAEWGRKIFDLSGQ